MLSVYLDKKKKKMVLNQLTNLRKKNKQPKSCLDKN